VFGVGVPEVLILLFLVCGAVALLVLLVRAGRR